jgi:hypothetical protein
MAKLTSLERKAVLHGKLEEQRHLLRNAVYGLAAGDLAEALHVSTILRVLVHETGSSTPLLKQITPNYLELPILDEPPQAKENLAPGVQKAIALSVPAGFRISAEGVFLNPELPDMLIPIPLGIWWERHSLIITGAGGFSRKELVLGIANKEGGAHIDLDVSKRYQALLDYKSFQIGWGQPECMPVNVSRMVVGHAGVEMLECLSRNFFPS